MFNIFSVAAIAIFLGLNLAILITRKKAPGTRELRIPEEDLDRDPKDLRSLTLQDLQRLAGELCRENNLTIKDKMTNSERETYWVVESKNEFFFGNYVFGFCVVSDEEPYVTLQDLLEFKDFVKSMTTHKGFYFTTGYFTREVHQPLEGPRVTLYNRLKTLGELKKLNWL